MEAASPSPARRVVVGTAGHIDHGKTTLVEALTGIDCDRWSEEKQRGITIDLGFAHWYAEDSQGGLQIGFVDVPGHERFLHNALAGLGGIRVLLLVVAADEGVKPQTREHLAICSLLGIPACVVALTKADLVEPDLIELARMEVEELLADGPFAGAPIHAVSSKSGEGIEDLKSRLVALAGEHHVEAQLKRPVRLPIDRAFHLKGLGLVVTGTLASGAITTGDELQLLPAGATVRVRDVQVHGAARERAQEGERTSLRLAGVDLEEVERGMQLVTAGAFSAERDLSATFQLLPDAPAAFTGSTPVRLHHFATEVVGRLRPLEPNEIEPGASGLVEIRLAQPVVAARGDRFIIRRPSPPLTLGGGTVLDPAWRRPRGKALTEIVTLLPGGRKEAVLAWVAEAGEGGITTEELAKRLGEPADRTEGELEALRKEGKTLATPAGSSGPGGGKGARHWLTGAAFARVTARAKRELEALFQRDRLSSGMPKAEAVERFFPGRAARLAAVYLDWLAAAGTIEAREGRITLPGRSAGLTETESALATSLTAKFEAGGLTPPSQAQIADELNAKPQIVEGVIRYLTQRGKVVRLPDGLLVSQAAVSHLRQELLETGWETFSVPQFKERFDLSRKWAIPLLEHLDSAGATRRMGNERLIVRPR